MKSPLPILILLAGCSSPESAILSDASHDDAGFVIDTDERDRLPSPVSPIPENSPTLETKPETLRWEIISAAKHVVTIYTAEDVHGAGWCRPCRRLKAKWRDGNELIQIKWSPQAIPSGPDSYPAVRWQDSTGTIRFPTDKEGRYRVPESLDELLAVIERNEPHGKFRDATPVGAAGVLHGRARVAAALAWIREHVGENVPMSFHWDRTGAQTFPLLRRQDFSAIALLGKTGHVSLSAPGCKLPVDHVGFGYQVSGDDLIFDADPVKLDGLAARLLPQNKTRVASRQPVGFVDPVTIWSIFEVMKVVWGLLHPQADLTLGGNVSATATLQGDMLAIDFQQMPAIRLMMLFQFHLAVQRLELTPDKCRILFSGSRLIRERTIVITD